MRLKDNHQRMIILAFILSSAFLCTMAILRYLQHRLSNHVNLVIGGLAIIFFALGILLLHRHYFNIWHQRTQGCSSCTEYEKKIALERHRYKNQIQVLTSYIEMGMWDEAENYLERISRDFQPGNINLNLPEVDMLIYHYMGLAKKRNIVLNLNLSPLTLSQTQVEALKDILHDLLEVVFSESNREPDQVHTISIEVPKAPALVLLRITIEPFSEVLEVLFKTFVETRGHQVFRLVLSGSHHQQQIVLDIVEGSLACGQLSS